jgi:hypothetical protein
VSQHGRGTAGNNGRPGRHDRMANANGQRSSGGGHGYRSVHRGYVVVEAQTQAGVIEEARVKRILGIMMAVGKEVIRRQEARTGDKDLD